MRPTKENLKSVSTFSAALAVALFSLFLPLRAAADDDDPPSRVARLGYIRGSVSFQPAGTDDWVAAIVNRPITTGDKLWSGNGSRAELHIGSASIRMAGDTGFSFLNLTDNTAQIQLTAGTLRVRVKRLEENENFEIDTPNLAFILLRPGVYRINVNENGDSTIIRVGEGEGEVTGAGSTYTVHSREVASFNGTDSLIADFGPYGNEGDDFDAWCANRDRHEDISVSARYVSSDVIGYEDLDGYGDWRPMPDYGTVWFPRATVVDWAPYRYGHWAYVYPWGYTWIDDAPWGFAPFHYGRWVYIGGAWGWVPCPPRAPGVVYVRPVYAPALVAWIGGPQFAVGVGVGWLPLGPREVYVPSYPVSRIYVTNINISNTRVSTTVVNNYYNTTVIQRNTVIRQTYVNQGVPGAVTVTTQQAFTSARPVARSVVPFNAKEASGAQVSALAPAVAPAKQAVLGAGASATIKPPAMVEHRAVVAKATPPPPPVAFVKQQEAIQANGGKPLAASQMRQIEPANMQGTQRNVRIAPPGKPVTPQDLHGGRRGKDENSGNHEPAPASPTSDRPGAQNNAGQPGSVPASHGNGNPDGKTTNDRPPWVRSNSTGNNSGHNNVERNNNVNNPELDQKHQQQLEQLRTRQDVERQKIEQQQQDERRKLAQQNAGEPRQQQLNQKHQEQVKDLETKHQNQQQKLQQKQQDERRKKPPPEKDDHPSHDKS